MSGDRQEDVAHLHWLRATHGAIPLGAIVAGNEGQEPLYICRAFHAGSVYPGKIRRGYGGCSIGLQGSELILPEYEVLVSETRVRKESNTSGNLLAAVLAASNTIPQGGSLFLSDHEKQTLRSTCHDLRNLAIHSGCLEMVAIIKKTRDESMELMPSKDKIKHQFGQMVEIAKTYASESDSFIPREACVKATIAIYDLIDAIPSGGSLFLDAQEKAHCHLAALAIQQHASKCNCIALIDGSQKIIAEADAMMPSRSTILQKLNQMKLEAEGCLRTGR